MKTIIKSLDHNRVFIQYQDLLTEDLIQLELFAPHNGGYVKIDDGNQYPQICKRLSHTGSTLEWSGDEPLKELIKKEYRKLKREMKKELAISQS